MNGYLEKSNPIAVVGLGCRFAGGSSSPSKLWDLLEKNQSALGDVPSTRYAASSFEHVDKTRPESLPSTKGYFFAEDPREFDPAFFDITPVEAETMDPQQRKLLEVVFECFESAGMSLENISGSKTACYVGHYQSDFAQEYGDAGYLKEYTWTGKSTTILSNRVSYCFNLQGPSFTLDTACSASAYCVHLACQGLLNGDCTGAVVAGTNVNLFVDHSLELVKIGVTSATGTCHSFDADADGYGRGDGVAAIFLKRLSDAIRDNDPIRGVIRGSAINMNGRTSGITQPSTKGQARVMKDAYEYASVNPRDTAYVECHATGTAVGDPTELAAIEKIFCNERTSDTPLLVGSLKPNIGHTEPTSALASIIKIVQAFENGIIPATIGIKKLNPVCTVPFKKSHVNVVQENTPWPKYAQKRASINTSGWGGANAHIIIDSPEYIFQTPKISRAIVPRASHFNGVDGASSIDHSEPKRTPQYLFVVSGHDAAALKVRIQQYETLPHCFAPAELAYTLCERRTFFSHRAYSVSTGLDLTRTFDPEAIRQAKKPRMAPEIVFVFTGQGAQYKDMGRELLRAYPICLQIIRELDATLRSLDTKIQLLQCSLEDLLMGDDSEHDMNQAIFAQTACTALQIALLRLLQSCGLKAWACIGHSSGEIAAAYAAGALSQEQAILLAYYRGLSVARCCIGDGAMAAVGMGYDEINPLIESAGHDLTISCVNSPQSVTLSGSQDSIKSAVGILSSMGVFARVLRTGGNAYHSPRVAAAGKMYERLLHNFKWSDTPRKGCLWFSTVTGGVMSPDDCDIVQYWPTNLISPVNFEAAMRSLGNSYAGGDKGLHFVEIGPHSALSGIVKQNTSTYKNNPQVDYSASLIRGENDQTAVLKLFGELYMKGVPLDLGRINGFNSADKSPGDLERKRILDLPTYPFTYSKLHWKIERRTLERNFRRHNRHELLGSLVPGLPALPRMWRNILRLKDVPYLVDHKVESQVVFPFAGYIAMAFEAARQTYIDFSQKCNDSQITFNINSMSVVSALSLAGDRDAEIFFELRPAEGKKNVGAETTYEFIIQSLVESETLWVKNCSGTLGIRQVGEISETTSAVDGSLSIPFSNIYENFAAGGLPYGPEFRRLENVKAVPAQRKAVAELETNGLDIAEYLLHPAVIDNCFQLSIIALWHASQDQSCFLPITVESVTLTHDPLQPHALGRGTAYSCTEMEDSRTFRADCYLALLNSNTSLEVRGIRAIRFESAKNDVLKTPENRYFYFVRGWKPDFDALDFSTSDYFPPTRDISLHRCMDVLERLSFLCIQESIRTYDERQANIQKEQPSHLVKYREWLGRSAPNPVLTTLIKDDESRQNLTIETCYQLLLRHGIPEGTLVMNVHRRLSEILDGTATAVEVLNEDDVWNEIFTRGIISSGAYVQVRRVLNLLGHSNPSQNIIELGAGSGGLTDQLLKELNGDTEFRAYGSYMFTDISPGFFSRAQERFRGNDGLDFKVLDIEQLPRDQGFSCGSYDIVLAANVLHATSSVLNTLENVSTLLRPGGFLVLTEMTRDCLTMGYTMGTLPGWWLSTEQHREWGPLLAKESWVQVLEQQRFDVVAILDDYEAPYSTTSTIVARLAKKHPVVMNGTEDIEKAATLQIVSFESSPEDLEFMCTFEKSAKIRKYLLVHHSFRDLPLSGIPTIAFAPFNRSVLEELNREDFVKLQRLLSTSSLLIWVSSSSSPDTAILAALARSAREENPDLRIHCLAVDPSTPDLSTYILEQYRHIVEGDPTEEELLLRDGVWHIPRFWPAEELNSRFSELQRQETYPRKWRHDVPIRLSPESVRNVDGAFWEPVVIESGGLKEGEVQIQTEASGLISEGYQDVTGAIHIDGQRLTTCAAGIIVTVGAAVKDFRPGDRIACLLPKPSTISTRVRVSQDYVVPVDEGISSEVYAAFLPDSCAAVAALISAAKIQPQETVLIDYCGGLGTVAICIAQSLRAKVFIAISDTTSAATLSKKFGVPITQITEISGPSSAAEFRAATAGQGANISISFDVTRAVNLLECLGSWGRHVHVEVSRIQHPLRLDTEALRGNKTLTRISLEEMLTQPSNRLKIQSLLRDGAIMLRENISLISNIYQVSEISRYLEALKHGTAPRNSLLSFPSEEEKSNSDILVPFRPLRYSTSFSSSGSFLLVGGLGGVGSTLARWLCSQGGRNFVFLSRSAFGNSGGSDLLPYLQSAGARTEVIKGDCTLLADVERAVETAQSLGPLRGVIHAPLVLRDSYFSKLTPDLWRAVTDPKVLGLRNLAHALYSNKPDFLLVLSSISGSLGIPGQSNYGAANAFMDSYAAELNSKGICTRSISLGAVEGAGYVARNPEAKQFIGRYGAYMLSNDDVLTGVDLAIESCFNQKNSGTTVEGGGHWLTSLEPSRIAGLHGFNRSEAWRRQPSTLLISNAVKNYSAQTSREQENAEALVEEQGATVVEMVKKRLAGCLFVPVEELSEAHTLSEYGVDSFVAGQMRAWIKTHYRVELPVLEMLKPGQTVAGLVRWIEMKRE